MPDSGMVSAVIAALESTQTQKDFDPALLRSKLEPLSVELAERPDLDTPSLQRLVPALCSWLRAHEDCTDDTCLSLVLSVLARLLGKDTMSDGIAVQKGLLSTGTVFLQRYAADPTMARICLDVLASLSVVDQADSILTRLGTVPVIVDLLRKHQNDTAILEDAVTTLAIMAKRTRHRRTLSKDGSINVLVEVLKRGAGRPSLVVAVCRFLSNFAVKEDCCLTVLQHGGVDALMAAFNNSLQLQRPEGGVVSAAVAAMDTRAAVAAAIWTCAMDCKDVQNTLLSSGWLSSLAAVLEASPDHAGLIEAALGIVRSLSRNKEYQEDIVGLGFIQATIRSMQNFPDNQVLMKEGCGVLGNLATDQEIRVQLGECGVCDVVLSALSACKAYDDRKVAKLALGALSNLASCEENRILFSKQDSATVLLDVARKFMQNENILEYAVGALSHLAVHDGCNEQLVNGGAVEALLLFLGEHREDLQVTCKCLVALRRVLRGSGGPAGYNSAVLGQIASAGSATGSRGVLLLAEAMQEHIYDETVVRETALLLTALTSMPTAVPALMATAVKPCMKALEVHEHEAAVADPLAGFLASLPLEEDDSWATGEVCASPTGSSGSGSLGGLGKVATVPPAR